MFIGFMARGGPRKIWWFEPRDTSCIDEWIERVKQQGGVIRYTSGWLPVFSAEIDRNSLKQILCPEIAVYPVAKLSGAGVAAVSPVGYSKAVEQMQGKAFAKAGLTGLGVKIGITDAGFLFLNDSSVFYSLNHLWKGHQIVACRDYCKGADTIAYDECYYTGRAKCYKQRKNGFSRLLYEMRTANHQHGSAVLNAIAGSNEVTGITTGLAKDASFYLTRTDFGYAERIEEEDYYLRALEWLSSQGVRLVNTSLGYTRGRTKSTKQYMPYLMNGNGVLARAVNKAVIEKNMLVVAAAGNEGLKSSWKVIATPADAPAALTVGAYDYGYMKAGYSSLGPSYNSYLKPEVAAFSLDGTSFSAPAVCGFAACLLEKNPDLTATALKSVIVRSGLLYPFGNNYVGYGVPLATRALALLDNPDTVFTEASELEVTGDEFQFSDPGGLIPYLSVFHKSNEVLVIRQEIVVPDKKSRGVLIVHRPMGCARSTVQAGYKVIEVVWKP